MKRFIKNWPSLAVFLLAVAGLPAIAQTEKPRETGNPAAQSTSNPGELTKFDLDFPGGTPRELVAAIQKAMGRSLNVIVPDNFADTKLPALKMEHVNVAQLFAALAQAGRKSEAVTTGQTFSGQFGSQTTYQVVQTGYGFRQGSEGNPTDDTIWYFYAEKPVLPPYTSTGKVCRFYSLAPYLRGRYTVDDITTAIETGWKMLGETSPPAISFHKDTNLLIAVGEPGRLETISDVLKALDAIKPEAAHPGVDPNTGLPVHAEPNTKTGSSGSAGTPKSKP
jgi:hypothetical protein